MAQQYMIITIKKWEIAESFGPFLNYETALEVFLRTSNHFNVYERDVKVFLAPIKKLKEFL